MYTPLEVNRLSSKAATPHETEWNAMVKRALVEGSADFVDREYWPVEERFEKSRHCYARRVEGGIETMVENRKRGVVIYQSKWY